jgi:hypothetical protein
VIEIKFKELWKVERKLGPISAFGYLLVLVAGLSLLVVGGKDLLLLVVGNDVTAKVTSVDTRQMGRKRGGVQTTISYTYAVDGTDYKGAGGWHGAMQAVVGDKAAVRYLPFAPGQSAPKDALVGPGLLLVVIGAGLIAVDYAFFKKRTQRDEKSGAEKSGQGKGRTRRSAA